MQSISVFSIFSEIANFSDFQGKSADASRTQGVRQVIHIFFGFSLGKVKFRQVLFL